jgi:nucleotide-binding universal stress UspA family protein
MKKKKALKVLLAEDLSLESLETRSKATRACAGRLAQLLDSSVDLVHIENTDLSAARNSRTEPLIKQYFDQKKAELNKLTKTIEAPTQTFFVNGDPVEKLVSMGAKRSHEMIVIGTHGRQGIGRLLLGSVAEEVIRNAHIPVMTLGPEAQSKHSQLLHKRPLTVLIPTALTPNSINAEDYGAKLAKKIGAKLILFHSVHETLHPVLQTAFSVPYASPELQDLRSEVTARAKKALTKTATRLKRFGIEPTILIDDQKISSSDGVLSAVGKNSASLIVMGTHGRKLLASAFFGKTAREVILKSPVPVITVRSKRR